MGKLNLSKVKDLVLVTQLCLTLCDPMNCSPPGSSVCGILPARILEWVASPSLGDLPNPVIEPVSPILAGGFSYIGLSHQESPKDMRLNPIPCDFGS